jgi:hypothetical protein
MIGTKTALTVIVATASPPIAWENPFELPLKVLSTVVPTATPEAIAFPIIGMPPSVLAIAFCAVCTFVGCAITEREFGGCAVATTPPEEARGFLRRV